MVDFIPRVTKERSLLVQLLKKGSPPWNNIHTTIVKFLKKKVESLPPLQILGAGKFFLQTDSLDKRWGAVLIEEIDGKRMICGYTSGTFKLAQLHYHSTFKEIFDSQVWNWKIIVSFGREWILDWNGCHFFSKNVTVQIEDGPTSPIMCDGQTGSSNGISTSNISKAKKIVLQICYLENQHPSHPVP